MIVDSLLTITDQLSPTLILSRGQMAKEVRDSSDISVAVIIRKNVPNSGLGLIFVY